MRIPGFRDECQHNEKIIGDENSKTFLKKSQVFFFLGILGTGELETMFFLSIL
jgi:hypothetical protein